MALYTERHGMRKPIEKSYTISIKAYSILFDCCSRYFEYLAWKYPEECPDGNGCCGLDSEKFNEDLEFEIPSLFRRNGVIDKPKITFNIFDDDPVEEEFDQYALFDLIEFIAKNAHDVARKNYHEYFRHYDISFKNTNGIAGQFMEEINKTFSKVGLLYRLTVNFEIERIEEAGVLSSAVEQTVLTVKEPGLKELLKTAIQKHKSPYPDDQKDAVEKIWDALERMKTYYTTMDKRASASKIVTDMSGGQADFSDLFNAEFKALTDIGNDYRIRHHETNKIDITDIRHYDYFFNRCLALIATAIQYLN